MVKKNINFDLSDISEGAVQEKIDREMKRVAANIIDPNTDPKKKRKLTLTMTLTPNADRRTINVDTEVKSTLAPQVPVSTTMMTGRDMNTGEIAVNELLSGVAGQAFIDPDDGVVKTDTGTPVDEVEASQPEPKPTDASATKSADIIDYQKRQQN